MSERVFLHALLPGGWAKNVRITATNGVITKLETDVIDAVGSGIALPGLPNLHSHTFQRGMAGLAETRGTSSDSFWTWRQVMYHFLDRLSPDNVEAIAAFAFMEMLERGFTAVGEFHYLHHDIQGSPYADIGELSARIFAAASATGIGLTLLPVLYSYAGFDKRPAEHGQRRFVNDLDRFATLLDRARQNVRHLPDSVVGLAPHSLRAVDVWTLGALSRMADGGPIHIHIAEQLKEVDDCLAWSECRPVELLFGSHEIDAQWCLIHATHLTDQEVRLIAKSGAVVGLCPITEANLGDGIFPGQAFAELGGAFGVGSDSNVEIDAPGELRLLEYGQRLARQGRNVMAPAAGGSTGRFLYEQALAGGRQALGRPTGSLEVGQRADIVVLDDKHIGLEGRQADQWLDCYLFAGGADLIASVIVGGDEKVSGGRHRHRELILGRYRDTLRRLAV